MRTVFEGRSILAAGVAALAVAACGGPAVTTGPTGGAATPPAVTQAAVTLPPATTAPTQPPASANPLAFVSQFEGTYSGTWTNTTFGSTGPVSLHVAIDRTVGAVNLTLDLGGNVFGATNPNPEALVAALTPGEGLSFESATFGATTVGVDVSGGSPVVTISSPDVPSARIKTFTATATIIDPKTIGFAYEVTFRDGGAAATGTAQLTR